MRHNLVVCSLLLGLLLVSSSVQVFGRDDPEKQRREEEERGSGRGRHEGGGGGGRQGGQDWERQEGRTRGDESYDRERQEGRSKGGQDWERQEDRSRGGQDWERQEGKSRGGQDWERQQGRQRREEEHGEGNNPYVFHDKHFASIFQTEHGRISELQRFSERSELLRGIDNYRLTILEAEPQTFIIPNHFDAEAVFFVVKGRGSISLVRADSAEREGFNIKRGDIVRIPSGTPLYLINRDSNEKLIIAKILKPVFTPGHFESFFGAGGENPESFYTVFSTELLEAALNTKRENLEKVFGGERRQEGVILKASAEQIKALSQGDDNKGSVWPFGTGGESKGTVNIFDQTPKYSNKYGKLYKVFADELKDLEDINIEVTFLNLTRNAMAGPIYASKATRIALVVEGEGYFEMACPHLSSQSGGHQSQQRRGSKSSEASYQKINTRLTQGTVVVIPAGHPHVVVASSNRNLEVVSFVVNARHNMDYALAGKGNVAYQFEKEAKELAFGVSSDVVDEVFGSQKEVLFFPGPQQQQQERGRRAEE